MLKVATFKNINSYRKFLEENQGIRFLNLTVDNYNNLIFTYEEKITAVIDEAKINAPIVEATIDDPEEIVLKEGDIYRNNKSELEYTIHRFGDQNRKKWLLQGKAGGEVYGEETLIYTLKNYFTKVGPKEG